MKHKPLFRKLMRFSHFTFICLASFTLTFAQKAPNSATGEWCFYNKENAKLYSYNITSMSEGAGTPIYVGTSNGLAAIAGKDVAVHLKDEILYKVFSAPNGQVYAFSSKSGASLVGEKGAEALPDCQILKTHKVSCANMDAKGRLWVATLGGGVSYFDGKSWTIFNKTNGLGDNNIYNIFIEKSGVLWFAGEENLSRYDGHRMLVMNEKYGIPLDLVNAAYEDNEGNIWFLKENALVRYDFAESWNQYSIQAHSAVSIKGYPAFVTESSVFIFDGKKFTEEKPNHGKIFKALEDKKGQIWYVTEKGLLRYDKKKYTLINNSPEALDFLSNGETTDFVMDERANIWIGSKDGLAKFNQASVIIDQLFSSIATGSFGNFSDFASIQGFLPDITDYYGITPLMLAAKKGNLELVNKLLSDKASVKLTDYYGQTALTHAVWGGNTTVAESIINNAADVNHIDAKGYTPLIHAAIAENTEMINFLLGKGAKVNIKTKSGASALKAAAQTGNIANVRLLVEKGANVNTKHKFGGTALMYAADFGRKEVAEYLISQGANLNTKIAEGYTALMEAADEGHYELVKLLVEKGADIQARNKYKVNALMFAADIGSTEITRFLIEKGLDVNSFDKQKFTILMAASDAGYEDIVNLLLEKGANLHAKDKHGYTALHCASDKGHINIVKTLLAKGADVNVADKDNYTPLMAASAAGHIELAELLISKGAQVNTKTKKGQTALDLVDNVYNNTKSTTYGNLKDILQRNGALRGKE